MSRAKLPSRGKPYGLARVAAAWAVPRSTDDAHVIAEDFRWRGRGAGPRLDSLMKS